MPMIAYASQLLSTHDELVSSLFQVGGKGLSGGTINLSAKLSSQYVSSILLSAPYALNDVDLRIKGRSLLLLHSISYMCCFTQRNR